MTDRNDNVMEISKNDLDISKFLEEFNKMKLFFTNEISDIKKAHNEEINKRDIMINNLQARIELNISC